MTDDVVPADESGIAGRPPAIIRGACILLLLVGIGTAALSLPGVFDPAGGRCHLSRAWIDQANDDKKDWNNVDTAGRKPKDLPCDEAIRLAGEIRLKEKGTKTASVPSEGALLAQNALAVVMGAGQAVAGVIVLRRLSRQARAVAIGFSAAGIILQVLGIISLGVAAFVVYAFVFSRDSREIWPKTRR